ncbi:hypothetical protein PsorP6_003332 [Peronosclerospora sorghi]|uniref:Uncharacterized protein n=1 Tax=Peronosclerospora sorghi TaxID=230839 RepID=A0ACC0VM60_9STRA|nr:hypothetical protein PsorP6_003332 [Peronosclerospora sorghi]
MMGAGGSRVPLPGGCTQRPRIRIPLMLEMVAVTQIHHRRSPRNPTARTSMRKAISSISIDHHPVLASAVPWISPPNVCLQSSRVSPAFS